MREWPAPAEPLLSRARSKGAAFGRPVALITGANRGLGFEVARQLAQSGVFPVLGTRNADRGIAAVRALHAEGFESVAVRMDVTSDSEVVGSMDLVLSHLGRLDIVVNNAGVFPESRQARVAAADGTSGRKLLELLDVNSVGAYRVAAAALPVMLRQGSGRIVNVSSDMALSEPLAGGGSLAGGYCVGYRMSKVALNTMTQVLAAEVAGTGVRVNAVTPGAVRTAMGRPEADRSLAEGADSIVWLATLGDECPNGRLVRDRRVVPW